MALPVLCGPNRCALVYNQDRQPLIELSLQVNLPVVELLHALSQVAPRDTESEPSRPSLAPQQGITTPSYGTKSTPAWKQEGPQPSTWVGWYPNSDWQPTNDPQTSVARHSWEPCPPSRSDAWEHQHASLAQKEEQMQLLWALTDRTGPTEAVQQNVRQTFPDWTEGFHFPPALLKLTATLEGSIIPLYHQGCIAINTRGATLYGPKRTLVRRMIMHVHTTKNLF